MLEKGIGHLVHRLISGRHTVGFKRVWMRGATHQIAKELGTRPTRVSKWRQRFAQLRVPGLEDEPRSGRRVINDESVERRILDQLAKAPPPGFARWNRRVPKLSGFAHEYERDGTTTLFAALKIATVWSRLVTTNGGGAESSWIS